jgi:hypothetical protein
MSKKSGVPKSWISEVAQDAKRVVENAPPRERAALNKISESARLKRGIIFEAGA